jgi:ubiquitin carboxyl-terminal hydrolase 5/13
VLPVVSPIQVQERYLLQRDNIIVTAPADPTADFATQMSKLAAGVLTERYVAPKPPKTLKAGENANGADLVGEEAGRVANLEKYVVAPRMFKHVVGKGHPEFSSGRQQDASEYFQYFLEVLSKAERVSLNRVALPATARAPPTASLFEYHVEERFHCPTTNEVKYTPRGPGSLFNTLDLPVPLDKAVPYTGHGSGGAAPAPKRARVESKDGEVDAKEYDMCSDSSVDAVAAKQEPDMLVPFSACLQEYFQPAEVHMDSPAAGTRVTFLKTLRFQSFPRYLMVKVSRYYAGPNWVQVKITARIDVPEELDLTPYRGAGPQPGEQVISGTASASGGSGTAAASGAAAAPFVINEELVQGLMQMGFTENGCRRAAIATHNADLETAMNWICEHMEDPDFNDAPVLPQPVTTSGAAPQSASAANASGSAPAAADPEAVMMLTSMGYTEAQVGAALQATDNNIERYVICVWCYNDALTWSSTATGLSYRIIVAGGGTNVEHWCANCLVRSVSI